MKPLGCPSQFILGQQRAIKNNFRDKGTSYKCSTLEFVRIFVSVAATVYQRTSLLDKTEN